MYLGNLITLQNKLMQIPINSVHLDLDSIGNISKINIE